MPAKKVLILGYVWPEKTSSAAGLRTWNLINTFHKVGWQLIFGSASKDSSFKKEIEAAGVRCESFELNDSAFDQFIRIYLPDVVIFDRFVTEEQFGWRVRQFAPQALRIIDTQDLHFLRRARELALKSGSDLRSIGQSDLNLSSESQLREISAIYRSDLSLIISDFEFDLLATKMSVPQDLLKLIRFGYPQQGLSEEKLSSFEERKDFVMIGNFRHSPNADGVTWFRTMIWPKIRAQLPSAEVHIYGAYPPKEMMALDDKASGFRVKGWADDQFKTLKNYRVNLAPLRFGAGIKGKISDGWRMGTPVVTTPIGAEGMSGDLPWGGEIASDAESFAALAVELYLNPASWNMAQQRGTQIFKALYNEEKLNEELRETVLELLISYEARRKQNLVGAMLWHHFYRSTKYFSRWIELKNSLKKSPGSATLEE